MTTYTIGEWIEDYDFVAGLTLQPNATPTSVQQRTQDHFYSKYQDDPIGRFARFGQAMRFLDQYWDDLSFGRAGVAGSKECLVGEPLVRALHEHFASLPSQQIDQFPSIETIKALAIKHGA
jgi:hypothetical protein